MDKVVLILEILIAVVCVGCFVLAIIKSKSKDDKIKAECEKIEWWANKFVTYAEYFLASQTGAEKMSYCVNKLLNIAIADGVDFDIEQLKAVVQRAYTSMKNEVSQ